MMMVLVIISLTTHVLEISIRNDRSKLKINFNL